MRGKAAGTYFDGNHVGITPAYAGKSPRLAPANRIRKDHPRLCGEKAFDAVTLASNSGSPPPMRGKAEHFPPEIMRHRITPAYAGKSACAASRRSA